MKDYEELSECLEENPKPDPLGLTGDESCYQGLRSRLLERIGDPQQALDGMSKAELLQIYYLLELKFSVDCIHGHSGRCEHLLNKIRLEQLTHTDRLSNLGT